MSQVQINLGRRIFYDVSGAGFPLLLLAGRADARACWAPQVAAFARQFRVVTMDNRDAGEGGPEPGPYAIDDLADDAAELLYAIGIRWAHVLGHSMGGMIALRMALKYRPLVNRLVLVSTGAGGWSSRVLEALAQPPDPWIADPVENARARYGQMVVANYRAAHADDLEAHAARQRGNRLTPDGYMRQNAAIAGHDVRDRLPEVAAPALVVHGKRDSLIPFSQGHWLASNIPGAKGRLLVLPNTGHLPALERAGTVNRRVLDFLGAAKNRPR